jgi:predicted ATPase/DNA-binding winged helix-turn-helix (wHTH) protein
MLQKNTTPMPKVRSKEIILFGPFRLVVSERLLTNGSVPVDISARSFDILTSLLSKPTEVISKEDLIDQVWPGIAIEESNLRVHIAKLRKTLGDGKDGVRYIETVAGRGYCFVAPVVRSDEQIDSPNKPIPFCQYDLPSRTTMIGRDDDLRKLVARLMADRFVSIVGSGGVGKTTLAIAIGHHLMLDFAGAVLFVDLSMISDPNLVATVIASTLGLSVQSDDATPSLIAYLRHKRILLILDTCEHLVEAVAASASIMFKSTSQAHILVTSRETTQVDGENVYRLEPLECAPDCEGLTAAVAMTFPAIQLFLDRARASGAQLEFGDGEAAIVASMCRKLDGVALAIELAARRIEAYGLLQTAALLDEKLTLLWTGPRSAPPRQRTLKATLDWSYKLLSEVESVVLCRLAVFAGIFTMDAALEIASSAAVDRSLVLGTVESLVAKSMIATCPAGGIMRYRLLDTTRDYARESRAYHAEFADVSACHANYYRQWLEQSGIDWPTLSAAQRASHLIALNNVRAALEWCFGVNGNGEIGVELAAAAVPVFLTMSLLPECHRWSEQAIRALDETTFGGSQEMHLQAGLGHSSMQMWGESDAAHLALNRSLAIAEKRGDVLHQAGLLGVLHTLHLRGADFKTALAYARRCRALAENIDDSAAITLAHAILGRSLLISGDLGGARVEFEALLPVRSRSRQTHSNYLAYTWHYRTNSVLARTLWLQGFPAQAVERAEQTIKDAELTDNSVSLATVLAWVSAVFLWTGDLQSAGRYIESCIVLAKSHSLKPLVAIGQARKAELAILRGDAKTGVEKLRESIEEIRAVRFELIVPEFEISLVQGLAALGRFAEAIELIKQTIQRTEISGDALFMAEMLRIKGRLFLSMPRPNIDDAKLCFMQSLELSRRQGAGGWELRAASDLASLFASEGQPERGRAVLQPVFEQFVEGFETADLTTAKTLLSLLSKPLVT